MSTATSMFGGEVARLEQQLADAKRGQDNAERNATRLADLLSVAKSDATQLGKQVETLVAEKAALEQQLGEARARVGRMAELERLADEARRDYQNADKALSTTLRKLEQAEHAHAQSQADYLGTKAERDQLREQLGPAQALAAAVQARARADTEMVEASAKIMRVAG